MGEGEFLDQEGNGPHTDTVRWSKCPEVGSTVHWPVSLSESPAPIPNEINDSTPRRVFSYKLVERSVASPELDEIAERPAISRMAYQGPPPPAAAPVDGAMWNRLEGLWMEPDAQLRARLKANSLTVAKGVTLDRLANLYGVNRWQSYPPPPFKHPIPGAKWVTDQDIWVVSDEDLRDILARVVGRP